MNKEKLVNFSQKLYYAKWINFLIPASSAIVLVLLGILMKFSVVNDRPIVFNEWLIFMIMYFVILIVPYDLVRWLIWGRKKYFKKIYRRSQMFKDIEFLLDRARDLANIINETTNRVIFEESLQELKNTFSKLITYEKYGVFNNSTPSQDLKELLEKESIARTEFNKRELLYNYTAVPPFNINYDIMKGHEFEHFCADLLKSNGFDNVIVTQGSGDHGIDILADKDEISYAIQCKCYSSNVGNDAVQQALAGKKFYKRDIAVVLTNQYFTPQAKEEASVFGVKLWDRTKLNEFVQNINN